MINVIGPLRNNYKRNCIFLSLLAYSILFPTRINAAPPSAKAVAARTTCTAPCAVFFDGRGSSDADLSGELTKLNLSYDWNFGDPDSGYWTEGVAKGPKNRDIGFIAGHVYEKAGTYTATLNVSDGTDTDSDSVTVTITDPKDDFSDEQTWCFANSNSGSAFEACPTTDTSHRVVTNDFRQALDSCGIARSKARCLFRSGDTFGVSDTFQLSGNHAKLIQSYGTTGKAILELNSRVSVFTLSGSNRVSNIKIIDLSIKGTDGGGESFFHSSDTEVKNVFFYRIDISDAGMSVMMNNTTGTPGSDPDNDPYSDQIAMVEVTVDSRSASGGMDVYLESTRLMMLGCKIGNGEQGSHNVRYRYSDGTIMAHGWYGNGCGTSTHVVKVTNRHDDLGDGCGTNPARDFILADNYIVACHDNNWVVTFGPNSSRWFETLTTYIAERNIFDYGSNTYGSLRMLLLQGPNMVARNNVFKHNGVNASSGVSIEVSVRAPGGCSSGCNDCPTEHPMDDRTKPVNVQIYNNTFYSDRSNLSARLIELTKYADNAIVKNNLAYVPNVNSFDMIVDDSPNATFCDKGSGTGDCNVTITDSSSNPFGVADPTKLEDFFVTSQSLAGTGDMLGALKYDLAGRCLKKGSTPNVGATWLDGEDCLLQGLPMGIHLEADPNAGPSPLTTTLNWTTVNAVGSVSCDVDCGNGSFDAKGVSSPYSECPSISTSGQHLLRVRCSDDNGPVTSSVPVNVDGTPSSSGGSGGSRSTVDARVSETDAGVFEAMDSQSSRMNRASIDAETTNSDHVANKSVKGGCGCSVHSVSHNSVLDVLLLMTALFFFPSYRRVSKTVRH